MDSLSDAQGEIIILLQGTDETLADIIALDICAKVPTTAYAGSTPAELAETADKVRKLGRRVVATTVDIRDLDALQGAVDAGVAELGRLDVVVANAGITSYGRLWELTPEQFRDVVDVNLTGTWHTVKATVPTLIDQGRGGSIIITSSTAGMRGFPFLGHYAATKHALVGMAKALANELVEYGVRVISIHPGGVRSGMNAAGSGFADLVAAHPVPGSIFSAGYAPEMCEPEDVAALVAFLASDEARPMTCSQIPVDFGALAR